MPDKKPTLFERLGGENKIAELVDDFYGRVMGDPELKPFFKNTSMAKLSRMQREFFSVALDGPTTYTGNPLAHVHHGRGITQHHFARWVNHLFDALQDCNINEQDVNEIIGRINTYVGEITGEFGITG
ncbi:MAG: group 1 truncated hemoglobin [Desulfobacterales bacterium]|jgi:hemoglobin